MHRATISALLLALAACGGEAAPEQTAAAPGAPAQAAAPAPAPAPAEEAPPEYPQTCTLIPADAVNALVQAQGRSTTVELTNDQGSGFCGYPLADYSSLAVTAVRLTTPEKAAGGLAYNREAMGRELAVAGVPGLGDEAFEYTRAHIPEHIVHIRRGRLALQIRATKGERLPEMARALGRLALERIPAD